VHVLASEVLPHTPARTALTPTATALYPPIQPYYGPTAAPLPYSSMRDPWVARLLAGGAAVTGAGFALSFVLAALAAATTASGFVLEIIALVWLMSSGKAVITALGSSVH
jgi:hypothetical protein